MTEQVQVQERDIQSQMKSSQIVIYLIQILPNIKQINQDEPSIGEFFNNPELSDIIIIDNISEKQQKKYQLHRIILASKSTYFRKLFKEKPNEKQFVLPPLVKLEITRATQLQHFQQSQSYNLKQINIVESVLKFIYSDYDFAVLTKEGLNSLNCMDFFSYFSTLQVNSGIFLMEKYILQYILDSENSLQILDIAIKFKNQALLDNSVKQVADKFGKLLQQSQNFYGQLLDLSYEAFVQIIKSSDIQVESEDIVLSVVHDYIVKFQQKHKQQNQQDILLKRDVETVKIANDNQSLKINIKPMDEVSKEQQIQNQENQPKKEKINEGQDQNQNNQADNKAQQVQNNENQEKEVQKDQSQPAQQKANEYVQENGEIRQIQNEENNPKKEQNQEEIQDQPQKDETQLKPQDIIDQNQNQAQLQIVQKLIQQEDPHQIEQINQNNNNQDEQIKVASLLGSHEELQQINNQQITTQQIDELLSFVRLGYVSHSALNYFAQQSVFFSQRDIFYKAISLKLSKYEQNNMPNYQEINWNPRESYMNNVTLLNPANIDTQHNLNQGSQAFNNRVYPNSSQLAFQSNQQFTQQKTQNQQFFSQSYSNNVQKYVKPSQSGSLVFTYASDFDENGLLFFLGSKGNKIQFSNPFYLNEVMPFCSSLKLGRIEDLTARLNNNTICTENEKNSFFGFDLGEERYFFPTCYTLRNRSTPNCILFNWLLEGSNDNKQWFEIDKRIHFSKDSKYNLLLEKERELLRKPNKSSTWGIDTSKLKETLRSISIDAVGFRAFRITQISSNGSNTHEFAIGALEFYGKSYGMNWKL